MTSNPLPTGTITFLFTDIEGSTRLWENHPQAMQAALLRHDALLRSVIEDAGGIVFKTVGDAFCAVFATSPEALNAAANAQRVLTNEEWQEATPLRVRMALHTGTAQSRNADYFGPTLNRVARLLAAGYGGQVLVSAPARELVRDLLPEDTELLELGSYRLKDLERPERIYQLVHPALPDRFPPLRTMDNTPHNLPQPVTSFIGREQAIADVTALLAKTRLLTLIGAGGAGKTRLALQVAANVLHDYEGGAWLVEFAPVSDAALVPQAVASALNIKEQAGIPLTQTLAEQLKDEKRLLVLDNCEHVLTACSQLASVLLRVCPHVRVLATSREPLGISGEQTFRVPSLSLPNAKQAHLATVESVSQYEAVQLFVERALQVKSDFVVTNQSAPLLSQLCCHLDGIPLAIELAAARVRSLSIGDINSKLDHRFRLLTGGDRLALPRQQTLRALVDWSYDLLSPTEKTMFARLSVFAGGWTLPSAETVCGFDPVEEWETLDLLTSLVDKSLVVVDEQADENAQRFRLLETLKEYGAEKLTSGGAEAAEAQRRHALHFAAFACETESKLAGPEQLEWLNRLEADHDNFRAALDWFAWNQASDEEARATGLRFAGAMHRFWMTRGYLAEGRKQLARALQPSNKSEEKEATRAARAMALKGAGALALNQGEYAAARVLLDEGLDLFRSLGHKKGVARTLSVLGNCALSQNDLAAADSAFRESLALLREEDAKPGVAALLMSLGRLAEGQGDPVTARCLYEEALAIQRTLGDDYGAAATLLNLADVVSFQGDNAAARLLNEECVTIFRKLGNQWGLAAALHNLATAAVKQADYAEARSKFVESLVLARDLQDAYFTTHSLRGFASLFLHTSSLPAAARLWGACAALLEKRSVPFTPEEQSLYEMELERARLELGDAAFAHAWNEGKAMTSEQAIEFALTT